MSKNPKHLTQSEALVEYQNAKTLYPDAIVTLNQIECCGHWTVEVYHGKDKQDFLSKKFDEMVEKTFGKL